MEQTLQDAFCPQVGRLYVLRKTYPQLRQNVNMTQLVLFCAEKNTNTGIWQNNKKIARFDKHETVFMCVDLVERTGFSESEVIDYIAICIAGETYVGIEAEYLQEIPA